jgi:hypothetical protein
MNQKRPLSDRHRKFARAFLTNLAFDMGRSRAAAEAAKTIGLKGAANARRLAQDRRVKDYIYSLTRPEEAAAEAKVIASADDARERLSLILFADVNPEKIKPTDVVAAGRELSLINGWHAPTRAQISGKVEAAVSYEITDVPMSDEEWSKQYATEAPKA